MGGPRRLIGPAGIALAILLVGCAGRPPPGGLISAERAQAIAARSTTSSIPVTVTSLRLSTYELEAAGGQVAPAAAPVRAVAVIGSFPLSCGPAPPPGVTKVCPPPQTTQLILIDARTGAFIQGMSPAPSRP